MYLVQERERMEPDRVIALLSFAGFAPDTQIPAYLRSYITVSGRFVLPDMWHTELQTDIGCITPSLPVSRRCHAAALPAFHYGHIVTVATNANPAQARGNARPFAEHTHVLSNAGHAALRKRGAAAGEIR